MLKTLSAQLAGEYGSGFSVSALQYMRGFFLGYPELLAKQHAVRVEFDARPVQHALRGELTAEEAWRAGVLHPGLSWTHYRVPAASVSDNLDFDAAEPTELAAAITEVDMKAGTK